MFSFYWEWKFCDCIVFLPSQSFYFRRERRDSNLRQFAGGAALCTDWDAAGSKYGRPLVSTLNILCRRSFYVQADIDHLEVVWQNLTLSPNTECTILTNIILGEKKRNRAICWFSIQLLLVITSNSLQLTSNKKRHFISMSRSSLDLVETNCRVFNTNAPLSLSTSSSSKTLQVVDSTWLSIRAVNQGGCSRRLFQLFAQ